MYIIIYFVADSRSFLEFKRGDLIELSKDGVDTIQSSCRCYGLCIRTGKHGEFPAEYVYILPTMTKPPADILVLELFALHHFPCFFVIQEYTRYCIYRISQNGQFCQLTVLIKYC